MVDWFTVLVLASVFLYTFKILHQYPAKNTPGIVYFFVFIAYFNSFVIVILIPYDIYLSTGGDGDKSLLSIS